MKYLVLCPSFEAYRYALQQYGLEVTTALDPIVVEFYLDGIQAEREIIEGIGTSGAEYAGWVAVDKNNPAAYDTVRRMLARNAVTLAEAVGSLGIGPSAGTVGAYRPNFSRPH